MAKGNYATSIDDHNGNCIINIFCLKHCNLIRLSYSVWMLQEILMQTKEKSIDLFIMYDVACTLQKHLQVCCMLIFASTYFTLRILLFSKYS